MLATDRGTDDLRTQVRPAAVRDRGRAPGAARRRHPRGPAVRPGRPRPCRPALLVTATAPDAWRRPLVVFMGGLRTAPRVPFHGAVLTRTGPGNVPGGAGPIA
ncbi:hypothetical protein AB8O53_35415, partial [Streptomyces pilosus]